MVMKGLDALIAQHKGVTGSFHSFVVLFGTYKVHIPFSVVSMCFAMCFRVKIWEKRPKELASSYLLLALSIGNCKVRCGILLTFHLGFTPLILVILLHETLMWMLSYFRHTVIHLVVVM
jgi:hypothetical protein